MQVAQYLDNPLEIGHRITGAGETIPDTRQVCTLHASIMHAGAVEALFQDCRPECLHERVVWLSLVLTCVFFLCTREHSAGKKNALQMHSIAQGAMLKYLAQACCHVFPNLLVDHGARRAFMSHPVNAYIPDICVCVHGGVSELRGQISTENGTSLHVSSQDSLQSFRCLA